MNGKALTDISVSILASGSQQTMLFGSTKSAKHNSMTSVLKIQLILFIYLDTYIDTYIYTHTEQQLLKHLNHATDYFNHALTHG